MSSAGTLIKRKVWDRLDNVSLSYNNLMFHGETRKMAVTISTTFHHSGLYSTVPKSEVHLMNYGLELDTKLLFFVWTWFMCLPNSTHIGATYQLRSSLGGNLEPPRHALSPDPYQIAMFRIDLFRYWYQYRKCFQYCLKCRIRFWRVCQSMHRSGKSHQYNSDG